MTKNPTTYAEVAPAINITLNSSGLLTYSVPENLIDHIKIGIRVLIPFGRRSITGYVVAIKSTLSDEEKKFESKIKNISDVLDDTPLFDSKRMKFYKWMSDYYFSPIGEVFKLAHPAELNVKSIRKFRVSGPRTSESIASTKSTIKLNSTDKKILELAEKTITLKTLQNKLKGKALIYSINKLIKNNLLEEITTLSNSTNKKQDTLIEITDANNKKTIASTISALRKKPSQKKIFNYLIDNGPTLLKNLRATLGSVDSAVKALANMGFITLTKQDIIYDPLADIKIKDTILKPNKEQQNAIDEINSAIESSTYSPFLLHGVTGSGKTLVYIEAIKKTIAMNKKTIMLVPEIALTTGAVSSLAHIFPDQVALIHSGLTPKERFSQWEKIRRGEVDIVIGARSALFAPLKDIGLIIVDEEHDQSYKQDEGIRYGARDSALMLASILKVTAVLGSATPAVETYFNAATGKLKLLEMKKRINTLPLPPVELMDKKKEKHQVISNKLLSSIETTLKEGNQILLLLNRRGFSNFIVCNDCGHFFKCLNCSVTLTKHKGPNNNDILKCHYCDAFMAVPKTCPECDSIELKDPGVGTEKLEHEINRLFPHARVGRMDSDSTKKKGSARKIIEAVEAHEIDILIGTQMVSKGHNFPNMALVGVLDADSSLNIPDFRSNERTFHLITQSAGRGGRHEVEAHVIVQTLSPENFSLKASARHDYKGFYAQEIKEREEMQYPPYSKLCIIRLSGVKETTVINSAKKLKEFSKTIDTKNVTILGPASSPMAKLRGKYRWQFLLKANNVKLLHKTVWQLKQQFSKTAPRDVTITIDMDPLNTL